MLSVSKSFAPGNGSGRRSKKEPLFVGSIKANIGHGEAAAGVSSLIKVLLMMQYNTIPPHCGIKTKINRKFPHDLAARHVRIAETPVDWKRPPNSEPPRRALINNFSAAGGNTALILEEGPRDAFKKPSVVRITSSQYRPRALFHWDKMLATCLISFVFPGSNRCAYSLCRT